MLGFTQTYLWTRDRTFLAVAVAVSDYFIERLSSLSYNCSFVPPVRCVYRAELQTADR